MKLGANLTMAFRNLLSSKLRSILAILGILVGTGSVVALISSSQLATQHALSQFKSLGTNLLMVDIQSANTQSQHTEQVRQLSLYDLKLIKRASSQIRSIAAYTSSYGAITMADLNLSGQVLGATEELAEIAKIRVLRGRFISYLDKEAFFCDVGINVAKKMRKLGEPVIGNQIKVGKIVYTIVGVLAKWQPSLFFYADLDNGVIVPLQTSFLMGKTVAINNLLIRLVSVPNIHLVQKKLKVVLEKILPGRQINFRNPEQIISAVTAQRKTFTWMLAAIGGISLLVGGIGVMNIMLVSVIERRREIGIRMAVGARPRDIMHMFLTEGVMLTLFGGIVGVITGVLVSFAIAELSRWQFTLFWMPPVLGFVVSVLVGLVSGFYPAFRASRLDPIQTLQGD